MQLARGPKQCPFRAPRGRCRGQRRGPGKPLGPLGVTGNRSPKRKEKGGGGGILLDFNPLHRLPAKHDYAHRSLLDTDDPTHPPRRISVHLLPAHKLPPVQPSPAIRFSKQRLHLLGRPRAQTGNVAVVDETEGDQRDDVGEEELEGPMPEVDGCEESDQRAEEEDGDEAGEGAGLKFKDATSEMRHQ